jgi:hypothetical protein
LSLSPGWTSGSLSLAEIGTVCKVFRIAFIMVWPSL